MGMSALYRVGVIVMLTIIQALEPVASKELSILLTNDDGVSSEGLKILSKTLRSAGYDVTVVAPATQQSGSGMKVNLGEIELVEIGDENNTFSVKGSPADAVAIGILQLSKKKNIDLVISGPNFGQNLGSNIFLSGTVGGAMMGVMHNIPSIALSVGIDLKESNSQPDRFPSTLASFESASVFLATLLEEWDAKPMRQVIKSNSLVNINYPEIGKENIKGYKWVEAGRFGGFEIQYSLKRPGLLVASISENPTVAFEARDLGLFNQGYITLSVLSLDWNAPRINYHPFLGKKTP